MAQREVGFSNSMKWVNNGYQQKQARKNFLIAREKFCKDSFILTPEFDFDKHRLEWRKLKEGYLSQLGSSVPTLPSSRKPFSNKTINGPEFIEDYSPVICEKTAFTPNFAGGMEFIHPWPIGYYDFALPRPKVPKPIAPWPSRDEMKYEGDDRPTVRIQGRCMALPRVPSNETVTWQHRAMIIPRNLDLHTYAPCEAEVLERIFWIADIEDFSEMDLNTPSEIVGSELFELLDPTDKL